MFLLLFWCFRAVCLSFSLSFFLSFYLSLYRSLCSALFFFSFFLNSEQSQINMYVLLDERNGNQSRDPRDGNLFDCILVFISLFFLFHGRETKMGTHKPCKMVNDQCCHWYIYTTVTYGIENLSRNRSGFISCFFFVASFSSIHNFSNANCRFSARCKRPNWR